jgi:hypothetical protein
MGNSPAGTWRRSMAFIGSNPGLALHPVTGITHTQDEFDVELDIERGFRAVGRRAELEISGVLDRRQFSATDFQLGETSAALTNVYLPCSTGRLAEFGVEWPGSPTVYPGPRGPSSSAYMAVAESWVM